MNSILVTGAAGNIGGALAHALLQKKKYMVVGIDNLSTGLREKLPAATEQFRFIKADVNDYGEISAIFHANRFDYVFHLAAVVGVQRTLANPLLVLRDIDGIKNVLSLSKNCGIERVYYSSSSEVYGEPVSLPQHEEKTPLNSRLPYAIVKNLGEAYFKSYHLEHGLPYTIFRFFNTYGPNQSEDFVVPRFVRAALRNQPITIYGDGTQTRTFCYVDDNTDAMIKCLEQGAFENDVLNIGSDIEWPIVELASLIIELTASRSEIRHLPSLAEGDMTRRQPDITKMRDLLKRELTTVQDGIGRLICHYKGVPGQ
jgi:UDP-glucuronate decarboxylase